LKATPANELYITLATDTILQDPWGRFYGRFESDWLAPLLELENAAAVEIIAADDERPAQVVRTKLVESFDARSGLPRWRDKALVAGSTARLVFANGKRPSEKTLKDIEEQGIGLRRGEGFGRVIFNHPAHTGQWTGFAEAISIQSLGVSKARDNGNFTQKWKDIVQSALQENGLTSDYVNQAIARQLIEMRGSDPKTLIEKLTAQSSPNDKDSYKCYAATTKTVIALLRRVSDKPGYWQRALVLLAEALMNNREKA
jgi:CRISPR-associated protein Csx10